MSRKEKLLVALVLGIPVFLAIIINAIGDIDQRRTQERLNNRPKQTYRDILTPEERKKYGFDKPLPGESTFVPLPDARERFQRGLREGSKENELIDKLSKGDYKDFYDYHDGPEGNLGGIDYHEIEDYFGGEND